ncbi:hypothetical protein DEDGFLLK_00074 [Lactiplantibacillus phage Gut-P1]|nr:hypothetical protein DEDGFLLK_00074 [Lactiplantibacillus phage Gut-P1]
MVNNVENEGSRMELMEQICYYQSQLADLEEHLDELELENDDLRYEIHELKKGDKDDEK